MAQNLAPPIPVQGETDDDAIRQTALDYMYGWNDADAARQQRCLHPDLAKRVVRPADASAWPPGDRLDELSALHLVQLTPHEPVPLQERGGMEVWILDRFANAASVKIYGDDGDYAHMARWNGRWVIINALWGLRPRAGMSIPSTVSQGPGDEDDAAITRTALDYIEGWYEGDAARVERSIHPALAKRRVIPEATPSGDRLEHMSALFLLERTRHAPVPVQERRAAVTLLDRVANAASVRIDATDWIDYLHVALWNGQWVIVNVLWELRPAAPVS